MYWLLLTFCASLIVTLPGATDRSETGRRGAGLARRGIQEHGSLRAAIGGAGSVLRAGNSSPFAYSARVSARRLSTSRLLLASSVVCGVAAWATSVEPNTAVCSAAGQVDIPIGSSVYRVRWYEMTAVGFLPNQRVPGVNDTNGHPDPAPWSSLLCRRWCADVRAGTVFVSDHGTFEWLSPQEVADLRGVIVQQMRKAHIDPRFCRAMESGQEVVSLNGVGFARCGLFGLRALPVLIAIVAVYRIASHYRRDPNLCPGCDYCLANLPLGSPCPECGHVPTRLAAPGGGEAPPPGTLHPSKAESKDGV